MAELVEIQKDTWSDIEAMKKCRLFEPDTIAKIVNERTNNSYRVTKPQATKQDCVNSILYEIDLIKRIAIRRLEIRCKLYKSEIDHNLQRRVRKSLWHAVSKYPTDLDIWNLLIEFYDEYGCSVHEGILNHLITNNGHLPFIWLKIAERAVSRKSDNEAIRWLTRGIREHKKESKLYLEIIKVRSQKKHDDSEEVKWREAIIGDYELAKNNIGDFEFYKKLYFLTVENPKVKFLREHILRDLREQFSSLEEAWDLRATMELIETVDKIDVDAVLSGNLESLISKQGFQTAMTLYYEAVGVLKTSRMWDRLLDFLSSICTEWSRPCDPEYRMAWSVAFEKAMIAGLLSEKHFLKFVSSFELIGLKYKAVRIVLEIGTKNHPKSVKLWYELIRYHLSRDSKDWSKKAVDVFHKAIESLKDLPAGQISSLWLLLLQNLNVDPDIMETVFSEGLTQKRELVELILPLYLEWKNRIYGIEKARLLMELPVLNSYHLKDFYFDLVKIELRQPKVNLENTRKCFERLVVQSGKNDADIWKKYIDFEKSYGNKTLIHSITRRAVQSLDKNELERFSSRKQSEEESFD